METTSILGLVMESPVIPRYFGSVQRYAGSREDMTHFIEALESHPDASAVYRNLIAGARKYTPNSGITNTVFSTPYLLFEEGPLLLRKEILLENQQWIYPLWNGGGLIMSADVCCISRIVARLGELYVLGTRCTFRGLRQSTPHLGSFPVGSKLRGLPMMVHYNKEEDEHQQLLYALHNFASLDELDTLIDTVIYDKEISCNHGCIDILGMG